MNPEEQQPKDQPPVQLPENNAQPAPDAPVVQDVVAPNPPNPQPQSQQPQAPEPVAGSPGDTDTSAVPKVAEPNNNTPEQDSAVPSKAKGKAPAKAKRQKNKPDPSTPKQYKPKKTSTAPVAFVVATVLVALSLMGLVVMSYMNKDDVEPQRDQGTTTQESQESNLTEDQAEEDRVWGDTQEIIEDNPTNNSVDETGVEQTQPDGPEQDISDEEPTTE